MKSKLTTKEKAKVVRLAVGVGSLLTSYVCLFILPITTLAAIASANSGAMSDGTTGNTSSTTQYLMLPFVIGLIAWLVSLVGGPGLIIRLLTLPSSVGYVAATIFLLKVK